MVIVQVDADEPEVLMDSTYPSYKIKKLEEYIKLLEKENSELREARAKAKAMVWCGRCGAYVESS